MTKFSEIYLEKFKKKYHFLTKFSEIYLEKFKKKCHFLFGKIQKKSGQEKPSPPQAENFDGMYHY